MWDYILLAVVAAVVGISIGVGFHKHFTQPCYEQHKANQQSTETRGQYRKLGECSQCAGDVYTLNGYHLQCNHPIHYTCIFFKTQLGEYYKPDMACKKCGTVSFNNTGAGTNKGLRNRIPENSICGHCKKAITHNARILACQHKVHETCWTRMEQTSTICSRCMKTI